MKPLIVEICTGTTCYVLGGVELLDAAERFMDENPDSITIRGMHCLGICRNSPAGPPPYFRIDGELFAGLRSEEFLRELDRRCGKRSGEEEHVEQQ